MEEQELLIEEWPRISFKEIDPLADGEVEGGFVGSFYKSFFSLLRFPETVAASFWTLFKEG